MRYSELIKHPLPPLPDFKKSKDSAKPYHAEVINSNKDGAVLAVTFFDFEKNALFINARHFFNGSDYITQNVKNNSKGEGIIENYLSQYDYGFNSIPLGESREIILGYLSEKGINIEKCSSGYYKDLTIQSVEAHERKLLKEKLDKRHKRITDIIDARMSVVGELPHDFTKWIDETLMLNSRYFFYNYRKSKNGEQSGYCSYCKTEFSAAPVRHDGIIQCRECSSSLKCKALGKVTKHSIPHTARVTYLEQTEDAYGKKIVISRLFTAVWRILNHKDGPGEIQTKKKIYEESRRFYYADNFTAFPDEKGNHEYYYDYFKSSGKLRWCNETKGAVRKDGYIYPHNINGIIQDSSMIYLRNMDFAEIVSHIGSCNIINLIKSVKQYPVIENMVKLGLHNMAACLYGSTGDYYFKSSVILKLVDKGAVKAKDFLKVDKLVAARFAEINITPDGYRLYRSLSEINPNLKWETFVEYIKVSAEDSASNIGAILKYGKINDYQLIKYIKKQISEKVSVKDKKVEPIITEWRDYLDMAAMLKIKFTDAVMYPKNLHAEHDRLVELLETKKNQEKDKKLKKRYELLKAFEYQNKKYIIKPLMSAAEFVKESNLLSHCVKTYIDRCANGETNIFGLRLASDPDSPFFTVQLDNNGKIVQNLGKHNCRPPESVIKFVNEWRKKAVEPNLMDFIEKTTEKKIEIRIKAAI